MKTDNLEVNGINYPIKVFLEDRIDSSARIKSTGIIIRLPLSFNREEISREILSIKSWAKEKITAKPENFKPAAAKTYKDGDILKIGEREYKLNILFKDKAGSSARIFANEIALIIASNLSDENKSRHISSLLSRCIAAKRINELKTKINELNLKHFNQKINKIFFKNNKINWGSCSIKGNINISTRLLFAPTDVLEYICVHELAHLIEFNHSEKFWNIVETAMPNYLEKEKWLKENGDECVF